MVNKNIACDVLEATTTKDITSIEKFAMSENTFVRSATAENPNTPLETLKKLSKDDDVLVVSSVLKNPNFPKELIDKMKQENTIKRSCESDYKVNLDEIL